MQRLDQGDGWSKGDYYCTKGGCGWIKRGITRRAACDHANKSHHSRATIKWATPTLAKDLLVEVGLDNNRSVQ